MYPHGDQCSQDSIDAEGFRDACRQIARLSDVLGLGDYGHTIGEVVDTAIARLAAQPVPAPQEREAVAAALDALGAEVIAVRSEHDPGCPGDESYCALHCPVQMQVRVSAEEFANALRDAQPTEGGGE